MHVTYEHQPATDMAFHAAPMIAAVVLYAGKNAHFHPSVRVQ